MSGNFTIDANGKKHYHVKAETGYVGIDPPQIPIVAAEITVRLLSTDEIQVTGPVHDKDLSWEMLCRALRIVLESGPESLVPSDPQTVASNQ